MTGGTISTAMIDMRARTSGENEYLRKRPFHAPSAARTGRLRTPSPTPGGKEDSSFELTISDCELREEKAAGVVREGDAHPLITPHIPPRSTDDVAQHSGSFAQFDQRN